MSRTTQRHLAMVKTELVDTSGVLGKQVLRRSVAQSDHRFGRRPRRLSKSLFGVLDGPVRGSIHKFKYRLALVADLVCVLRYDNEAGKGDHRHIGRAENSYEFADPETLLADFWNDVEAWRR